MAGRGSFQLMLGESSRFGFERRWTRTLFVCRRSLQCSFPGVIGSQWRYRRHPGSSKGSRLSVRRGRSVGHPARRRSSYAGSGCAGTVSSAPDHVAIGFGRPAEGHEGAEQGGAVCRVVHVSVTGGRRSPRRASLRACHAAESRSQRLDGAGGASYPVWRREGGGRTQAGVGGGGRRARACRLEGWWLLAGCVGAGCRDGCHAVTTRAPPATPVRAPSLLAASAGLAA